MPPEGRLAPPEGGFTLPPEGRLALLLRELLELLPERRFMLLLEERLALEDERLLSEEILAEEFLTVEELDFETEDSELLTEEELLRDMLELLRELLGLWDTEEPRDAPEEWEPPLYEEWDALLCPDEWPRDCAPRGRAKMAAAVINAANLIKCFISQWC